MIGTGKYILDENGEPQYVEDILVWSAWYEQSGKQRIVARTKVGKVTVRSQSALCSWDWIMASQAARPCCGKP